MSFFYPKRPVPIGDIRKIVDEAVMTDPARIKDFDGHAMGLMKNVPSLRTELPDGPIHMHLKDALRMQPPPPRTKEKTVDDLSKAVKQAAQSKQEPEFSIQRVLGASLFLIALLAGAIVTSFFDQLKSLTPYFQHTLEVLSGGTVALIVGTGKSD